MISGTTFEGVFEALADRYGTAGPQVTLDLAGGRLGIEPPGVAVRDLVELVETLFDEPSFVPTWVPQGLRIERLDLRRDEVSGYDLWLTIAASSLGWQITDEITVTGASIALTATPAGLSARVTGDAVLDGLALEVSIDLPDEALELRLAQVSTADGTSFLHANELVAPPGGARSSAAQPELTDLSIHASLPTDHYIVHVQARHLLDLTPFELDLVEAEVHLGAESSMTVWTDSHLDVTLEDGTTATIVIDLGADVGPDGWQFVGTARTTDVTLAVLNDAVARLVQAPAPPLPPALSTMQVSALSVTLDTASRDIAFACTLDWDTRAGPANGTPAPTASPSGPAPDAEPTELVVTLEHSPGTLRASGTLRIAGLVFELALDHHSGATAVVGVFHADGGLHASLADLLATLDAEPSLLDGLASEASVDIVDALLAWETGDRVVFAADLGAGIDLSGLGSLPLIGPMIPHDEALRLDFRPVVSTDWSDPDGVEEIGRINDVLPTAVPALPSPLTGVPRLDARLALGTGAPVELTLGGGPGHADPPQGSHSTGAPAATQPPSDGSVTAAADADPSATTWHPVDRHFGPLRIDHLGVHYDGSAKAVEVLLGGSISVGGLTLSLSGLGARYELDEHRLTVSLQGLGLDLRRGPLALEGAFVHLHDGAGDDFVGKVNLRTDDIAITALGAFTMIHGAPSMFVYGLLDHPLGGPVFFSVEGLAAGFAYNRRFHPPRIGSIRSFPLVADAVAASAAAPTPGAPAPPVDVAAQLARLHDAVSPALGEYFLAVGVRFSSFKLLDTFALLVVTFGEHTEIDLLGASTYQCPPGDLGGIPPIAHVELDLIARIDPAAGLVSVAGQLTENSYVYNNLCHLTGGFAFMSWFSGPHEGDFVLSLGGYHPASPCPPTTRPSPRMAIDYQVTPHISVTARRTSPSPRRPYGRRLLAATASIGSVRPRSGRASTSSSAGSPTTTTPPSASTSPPLGGGSTPRPTRCSTSGDRTSPAAPR